MMANCAKHQQPLRARARQPGGRISVFLVVLSLVVSFSPAVSQERHLLPLAAAPPRTAPAPRSPVVDMVRLATEEPCLMLQHALTWQRDGRTLPEPVRQAVA